MLSVKKKNIGYEYFNFSEVQTKKSPDAKHPDFLSEKDTVFFTDELLLK